MTTHKEKIEIEVEIPDGYRLKSFSAPKAGDIFINSSDSVVSTEEDWNETLAARRFILEKLPEPYVFPEWMPEGFYLHDMAQENCSSTCRYWLASSATIPGSKYLMPCNALSVPEPSPEQYANGPLLVTHKK